MAFDKANASGSYSFDWVSDAPLNWPYETDDWNDRFFNTPVPCLKGADCTFTGRLIDGVWVKADCGFVHPGEEGVGRVYCPGRWIFDKRQGKKVYQEECIRLYGTPEKKADFYERRRLHMTWPVWCAHVGIEGPSSSVHHVGPPYGGAKPPSHHRKQILQLEEAPVQEAKHSAQPQIIPDLVSQLSDAPLWPVRSALDSSLPLVKDAAQDWTLPIGFTPEEVAYLQSLPELPPKQCVGELLFLLVNKIFSDPGVIAFLNQHELITPKTSVGKIVGMILDAYELEDLARLTIDSVELQSTVSEALFILKDAQ